jgi:hypothetical protein
MTLLAVSLSACSGGQNYSTPREMADALADAGLPCSRYEDFDATAADGADRVAECGTDDGRTFTLVVQDEGAPSLASGADLIFEGTPTRALVHDGRWVVLVDDQGTAEDIQEALGGKVTRVSRNGE